MNAKKPGMGVETLKCITLVFWLIFSLLCDSQIWAETTAGLSAAITEAHIGAHRRPIATVKITDGKEKALELADLDAGSIAFTIAAVNATEAGETRYHNYILNRVAGQEFMYNGTPTKPVLSEALQPDVDRGGAPAKLLKVPSAGRERAALACRLVGNVDSAKGR